MLLLANVEQTIEAARARLQEKLDSGAALETLRRNIAAQGGDPRVCDDPASSLPLVTKSVKVESPRSGFISRVDTAEIGHAIAAIGGGRVRIEDVIDPSVGFVSEVKIGDRIEQNEPIGVVFCADQERAREAAKRIQASYSVADEPPAKLQSLVKEVINE
jgi:thymidine phosphorylase